MRRIACIALTAIRLEIATEVDDPKTPRRDRSTIDGALAVIVARPGAAVQSERDVRGGTRLDVVSNQLHGLGVRAGDTVSAARAKCATMRIRVISETAVHSALVRVTEAALAFGPAAGFDMTQDVVWVEIGGCAHLHGGEPDLARALAARVRSMGHSCRVAIADGPRIAAATARFAPVQREPWTESFVANDATPLIVPKGQGGVAVRKLPVVALGLDDRVTHWLSDLGLRTCGDLQRLPRRSLGTRLGAQARDVLAFLDGNDNAPLTPWRPPDAPEERFELEWGATSVEALAFVMKILCDRLAVRLEGRAMAAARITIVLELDRALCGEAPPRSSFDVVLPAPLARASDLLAVARARMEGAMLAAPILALSLRAPELASAGGRTLELLTPEPRAKRALPRLVAEITAELGPACVGTLQLVDTWVMAERTRLVPCGVARDVTRNSLVMSALEPSRVIGPVAIDCMAMTHVERLLTVEAVEWWRRGLQRRHWVAAWTSVGESAEALAWVEMTGDERTQERKDEDVTACLRGWID